VREKPVGPDVPTKNIAEFRRHFDGEKFFVHLRRQNMSRTYNYLLGYIAYSYRYVTMCRLYSARRCRPADGMVLFAIFCILFQQLGRQQSLHVVPINRIGRASAPVRGNLAVRFLDGIA